MRAISMEQFETIRNAICCYSDNIATIALDIPCKEVKISAIGNINTSKERAIEAMKMNITEGWRVRENDLKLMLESVEYCIKDLEETLETNPDCYRKGVLDNIEKYKALREAIQSWFPKTAW